MTYNLSHAKGGGGAQNVWGSFNTGPFECGVSLTLAVLLSMRHTSIHYKTSSISHQVLCPSSAADHIEALAPLMLHSETVLYFSEDNIHFLGIFSYTIDYNFAFMLLLCRIESCFALIQ